MSKKLNRRSFIGGLGAAAAITPGTLRAVPRPAASSAASDKPALLGGTPVRSEPFPDWPVIGPQDRQAWGRVLETGKWNRGPNVHRFEQQWADTMKARYALATSSGTSALFTALAALDIGPGDEVIVPPYTFVATVNVVLLHRAVPVFVDSDRETFQIDATKIEAAISDRTRCIMPVHLGGNVADLGAILEIGRRRGIPVLEDACQAHLAEWRGKPVGPLGDAGCFSFQASKNLNSGEGGAIVSNDAEMMAVCSSIHNTGRGYTVDSAGEVIQDPNSTFAYVRCGDNRRLTEFQGTLLLEQLARLEEQASTREDNARYLTQLLNEIPGISPAREYEGCTRNAYHLYMFRYDPRAFSGLTRKRFLEALRAEGIPCGGGYSPLNRELFLEQTFNSRGFRHVYGEVFFSSWQEKNQCPENDRLCAEAVWLSQTQLLGSRSDMDEIGTAVARIHQHAEKL